MKENRRSFGRFATGLKAYYYVSTSKDKERSECSIINMSRKGLGLQIKTEKKINIGSAIRLEIFVPDKRTPAVVQGTVKWLEKRKETWSAGVECKEVLDEMKFSKRN
jgi:hypothetical protein